MYKNTLLGFALLSIFLLAIPVYAENITEPESLWIVDSWLSSDPQPGADHHVIKVCKDYAMSEECTQCIYKANSDGSVHIPTYNRCIFRPYEGTPSTDGVLDGNQIALYYQLKAVTADGLESEWTEANWVMIYKDIDNRSNLAGAMLGVYYFF